ncbi:MAG: DNA polymerase III subunit beta [Veillonella sp.]|uniref:DNA polymerase III subunit beta n=1 Tax=Veillonella sp. TaxID=1926307 RepID=UPI0025D07CC8|nr:DNA polymerase III subunit beta [Veillonella sp.]MBS4913190.1 DNA polymerase III subunit beta [Veillonella sp.]
MKIQFSKDNLLKAINALSKVSQNKTSSNLPGSIYITTKDNKVEMQANDYQIGIKITVDATIIEEGTIVLGMRYFQDWIRKTPSEIITLETNEQSNQLLISTESSQFNLVTMDLDDFMLVDQIHDQYHIDIDGEKLKEMIDLTNYAASTDQNAFMYTGALLESSDKELTMVATNTYRMAIKKVALEEAVPNQMRMIIPTKTLAEVSRLLPVDNPTMVRIIWNRSQVAFIFDTVYLISRLIEANFPDYNKVIPSTFDSSAVLNRRDFAGAVDRVSLLAKDAEYNVIRYDWNETEVTLTAQNSDIGAAKEEVLCEFKGTPFTISFNSKYISDILRHSTGDLIHLYLKQNGPVVIRQDNNSNYTYVVTPIRK